MRCRRNIRSLIQQYNAAADKPATALSRFVNAVLALKGVPSRLPAPHTQANRYNDYVYVHQQSMAGDTGRDDGPHSGHKGPAFFPWHREYLRQFELDLRAVSGNPDICLPYWDFSTDQVPGDPGYPFIDACLGGDGTGPGDTVETGPFTPANGFSVTLGGPRIPASIQRRLGRNEDATTLPSRESIIAALAVSSYDAPSYNRRVLEEISFRNQVEGWVGRMIPNIHNRVHVWVGGSMEPPTSPNDPVFFLNHAKEDQLWAVWAQKYPETEHYLPGDDYAVPPEQHHLRRLSENMGSLAEYFGAGTIDRPIDLLDNKAITWYDTDLPDIVLESGPALAFNNTPAGLTVARRIRFRVMTCRPVFFSITGAPSGNFSLAGGPDFPVMPAEANDVEILEIEVRFVGAGPSVQVSAVDIQAHIVDAEGYYAPGPGDQFVVRNFRIELVANNIVTSDSSIVLVLDRSGSMDEIASGGLSKNQLLKSAVGVVHELMKDTDQIGIARFDNEADVLLPMTAKAAGLGTTLSGPGLEPRGTTNIAGGILVGSGLLNGPEATHPNKAMIVLTDGNDHPVPNTISTLPPGTINNTTFAIGFGLAGQVNDATLSEISANTDGYLLVTGDMSTDDERFNLSKYFIQVLKDATLSETIVDPAGHLLWNGPPQEITFQVADSDVSIDVVVLCPIPFALDFSLITPGGRTVGAAMSGTEPNVLYRVGTDLAYYRLMLPSFPGDTGGSHRGTWKAVLSLKKMDVIAGLLRTLGRDKKAELADRMRRLRQFVQTPTPYNLTAYTYSNLRLDVSLRQSGFAPGERIQISASLTEYMAPLAAPTTVWADVVQPDASRAILPFVRGAAGDYRAEWVTSRPGIYQFMIRAEGRTSGNARFMRGKIQTATVWAGGNRPYDPPGGGKVRGDDERICAAMLCVVEYAMKAPALRERLKQLGIDLKGLRSCIEAHCRKGVPTMEGKRALANMADVWQALQHVPELSGLITTLAATGLEEVKLLEAAPTKPVKRLPKMEVGDENLFLPAEPLPKPHDEEEK